MTVVARLPEHGSAARPGKQSQSVRCAAGTASSAFPSPSRCGERRRQRARGPSRQTRLLLPAGRGLAVACASRYAFGRPGAARRDRRGKNQAVDFAELFERERSRYDDGIARLDRRAARADRERGLRGRPGAAHARPLRRGSRVARPCGGALAGELGAAPPASWGRPVGAIKAAVIAGSGSAEGYSRWALALGSAEAESPIGRYAATLALLVLRRWPEAGGARVDAPGAGRLPGGGRRCARRDRGG